MVNKLDPYRTKAWRVAKLEMDGETKIASATSDLTWEIITPTTEIYKY